MLKPGFVADNRAALAEGGRPHRPLRRHRRLRRRRASTCSTPPRCASGARCSASTASASCRTTPCSTSSATSRRASEPPELYVIGGVRVGVSICEDAWSPNGPIAAQAAGGAELVVNINASPYFAGRLAAARAHAGHPGRRRLLRARVRQPGRRPGRAGLRRRLDGVRRRRRAASPAPPQFVEELARRRPRRAARLPQAPARSPRPGQQPSRSPRSWSPSRPRRRRSPAEPVVDPALDPVAEVYEALVLGTRDYVRKNGFTDVVLGLSGGIDSSLVACIAADALGAEHVHGVVDAVALLERGLPHRRRGPRRRPRRRLPHDRHRGRLRRLPRAAGAVVRRPRSPTSPRRTCRAASAACC